MDKQSKKPRLEVIAPTHIRSSEVVPVKGETAEELERRNEVFFAVMDAVEEDYPPLTDDQMRAIRAVASNPTPGGKLISKKLLFR